MNREQRNDLIMKTQIIDRNFGKISHKQTHQDMMRIMNRLVSELYDTQQELRELKEKLNA